VANEPAKSKVMLAPPRSAYEDDIRVENFEEEEVWD
jgi:hypothetical protein